MKYPALVLLFLVSLLSYSCSDDMSETGTKIQPIEDAILVGSDFFNVKTENVTITNIDSKPDSFLIGKFFDKKTNSVMMADVLAQLKAPTDVEKKYPDGVRFDSIAVTLSYLTAFGDTLSPMEIGIYKMKKTFDKVQAYKTNLDVSDFCDVTTQNLLQKVTFKPSTGTYTYTNSNSVVIHQVRLKLDRNNNEFNNEFGENMKKFSARPLAEVTDKNFFEFFKGIYITTNFGSVSMINVQDIVLKQYYSYPEKSKTSAGKDTTIYISLSRNFPASPEVRRINRIVYPNQQAVSQTVASNPDVNYIASPANFQTSLTLPLVDIKTKMDAKVKGKQLNLNSATMKVEVTDIDANTYAIPTVNYLLLIKESEMDRFFKNDNELPSDSTAVLASYSGALIKNTTTYEYYYNFNLTGLIARQVKDVQDGKATLEDLKLRFVPVEVTYNSSSVITKVKQANQISAVRIKSGQNTTSPMKLHVVYSGF